MQPFFFQFCYGRVFYQSLNTSSSSTHQWTRDVFLSFRGADTRYGFTTFLHRGLCDRGINSLMDLQLRKGDRISSALLQEIVDSRFSIIIFSRTYASSSWCLDELTKILDCVNRFLENEQCADKVSVSYLDIDAFLFFFREFILIPLANHVFRALKNNPFLPVSRICTLTLRIRCPPVYGFVIP